MYAFVEALQHNRVSQMIGRKRLKTYSDNVMTLWSAVSLLVHEDQLTSVLVQSGGHELYKGRYT